MKIDRQAWVPSDPVASKSRLGAARAPPPLAMVATARALVPMGRAGTARACVSQR